MKVTLDDSFCLIDEFSGEYEFIGNGSRAWKNTAKDKIIWLMAHTGTDTWAISDYSSYDEEEYYDVRLGRGMYIGHVTHIKWNIVIYF